MVIWSGLWYIAVGGNESISYICYSTDDVNWTTKQVSCRYLYGATYGNGKYIVMGDGGYIAYSTDGINWTSKIVGLITWAGGAYGNGKYVVIGNNGYIAYSTDDINWIMKG